MPFRGSQRVVFVISLDVAWPNKGVTLSDSSSSMLHAETAGYSDKRPASLSARILPAESPSIANDVSGPTLPHGSSIYAASNEGLQQNNDFRDN